ncbi:MAG TPA: hypothetical protein VIK60_16050 [Vicinamibacterales bacterium]
MRPRRNSRFRSDAFDESLEFGVGGITRPAGQVGRLPTPEFERLFDVVKKRRNEDVAF